MAVLELSKRHDDVGMAGVLWLVGKKLDTGL